MLTRTPPKPIAFSILEKHIYEPGLYLIWEIESPTNATTLWSNFEYQRYLTNQPKLVPADLGVWGKTCLPQLKPAEACMHEAYRKPPGEEATLMILPESLFFSASHYADEVVYYVLQRALFEGEVVWLMTVLYAAIYTFKFLDDDEPIVDIESIKRAEYSIKLQRVF